MIIIKGKHSVLEALHGPLTVHEVFIIENSKSPDIQAIISLAKSKGSRIKYIDKYQASKQFNVDSHQHVIAKMSGLPLKPLSLISKKKPPIILALDHLEDPFNVGAIMRTCECLGITTIIVPKDRQAPLNSGVIKASSGAIYYIDIIQIANITQALQACQKQGYWIYGADSETGTSIEAFSPAFPCVLVMGNEHKGLSKRVSGILDESIKIPMHGQIGSFNVSVATGIFLHEFVKASPNISH